MSGVAKFRSHRFVRNKQPWNPASAIGLVAQVVHPLQAILDVRIVRALSATIAAVAGGADLTLTSIGRRLPGGTVKHHIKRVDRLLGNASLKEQLSACWAAVGKELLPPSGPIHILIDWTGGPNGSESWILSASLPHEGRAIRVYETVCLRKRVGLCTRAKSFLRRTGLLYSTKPSSHCHC